MQTGEYITHRLMVGIIREICLERGIEFSSMSDGWLLELTKDEKVWRILGYKFSLNDAVASSIAGDKVATHLLLKRANLPSVEHALLRPPVSAEQKKSLERWGRVVVKPLDGSGGHGVKLFENIDTAADWIESTDYPAWAVSPFVDIEREIRFVLLDGKPLIAYEKLPVVVDGLKMFNLGLGAQPKNVVLDETMLNLVAQAQSTIGLRLSAVDLIETTYGELKVLEINSGFMMEHYIRSSPENKQRGVEAYGAIVDALIS